MTHISHPLALVLLLGAALPGQAAEALRFANVFADHAVLQQLAPLCIWGFAPPGQKVVVAIAGAEPAAALTAEASAGADGVWAADFAPLEPSFAPRTVTAATAGETVTLRDVLVGEVWLCSGQSNMQWGVRADTEWGMERRCADYPAIRACSFGAFGPQPLADLPERASWRPFTPDNEQLERVSAVAYHFAVRLHRYLKVPVGIVCNAVGGTLAETWTSRPSLEALPAEAGYLADFAQRVAGWPEERARREQQHAEATAKATAEGTPKPRAPNLGGPLEDRNQPAGCYNATIAPLGRLSLRGALFFQGENNSIGKWNAYRDCLPRMIADWRECFGDAELPFGIVSLQAFGPHGLELEPELSDVPPGLFWYAAIRDVHLRTFRSTPHTGLIAAHDVGDTANIHPAQKREIGQRAARWALAAVYGEPVIHQGPVYRAMQVAGGKIELLFDFDPALAEVVRRKENEMIWWLDYPISRAGNEYRGFVIAGADRRFHPANVKRSKQRGVLEVWSAEVPEPVAVRYAWAGFPAGNAIGHDHLPVPPFRTDDWPLCEDTPFAAEAAARWQATTAEQRARALRHADLRKLAEAATLVEKVGSESGRRAPPDERAALQSEVDAAAAALQRLRQRLADLDR